MSRIHSLCDFSPLHTDESKKVISLAAADSNVKTLYFDMNC